jgi:tetratricopeptide (TPR) repeat protein
MKAVIKLKANIRLYKEWFQRWGSLPVRSWVKAAGYYRNGNYEEAARCYQVGLKSHPRHPARGNALLDLSHCLFRLKKFDHAERYLRQASVVAPNHREPYLRLARLQLWLGHSIEAAWTVRSALNSLPADPELVTLFVTAAVESGGVGRLVTEAQELLRNLHCEPEAAPRLEVARARLAIQLGDLGEARDDLAALANKDRGPFEAVIAFAQVLLDEGKTAYARHHLHRSLRVSPEHPRVLRMLALSYVQPGPSFDPEHAIALATKACQATGWCGIHEMYVLAKSYALAGDKISALLVASKAQDTGRSLLSIYPEFKNIERLIDSLSSGTQA